MPTRVEPRAFVNFSVRLDLESNERRRRLEKALELSAPRLLEHLFCNFENDLLNEFSDAHREAYLAGALDAHVCWKTSCRVAADNQMMITGEPGSGKSHLHARSISTAKDAKNSSECHDLSMASLGDFGILRNEGGGR